MRSTVRWALLLIASFCIVASLPAFAAGDDGELHLDGQPDGSRGGTSFLALPPGFTLENVITGLNQGVVFDFAPDGRIFIGEKSGIIRVYENGALLPTPFADITTQVNNRHDRGLLGLAVHPDFPAQPYIYLLFTYDPPEVYGNSGAGGPDGNGSRVSRLVRLEADPATNHNTVLPANGETVMVGVNSTYANIPQPDTRNPANPACGDLGAFVQDCIPADEQSHTIGTVRFGIDGSLYLGSGDGGNYTTVEEYNTRSLYLDSLAGKIMRIHPLTGEAYANNPYFDGDYDSNQSKVYQLGLRNPFRFTVHPVTGEVYNGDVGWGKWEEVNVGAGANFGWPCYEGANGVNAQQNSYASLAFCQNFYATGSATPPLYAYDHAGSSSSIQIGDFYQGTTYPTFYHDRLFFSDINKAQVWSMSLNPDGSVNSVDSFATSLAGITQISSGPDTNLYVMNIYNGELQRLRYTSGGNTPPTALAEVSQVDALTFDFDGGDSFDPDAQPLTYFWDFGDGATSTQESPTYAYAGNGAFTVQLTVTDTGGLTGSDSLTVIAGNLAPVASITAPVSGTIYTVGELVNYSGSGTDAEDGTLTGTSLEWTALVHHNQHVHLDYFNETGESGIFQADDHDLNSFYEICLTATDSLGVEDQECVYIYPQESTFSFDSVPSGLLLNYSGVDYTAPFSVTDAVGGVRTIAAPEPQNGLDFDSWSDGGSATHNITHTLNMPEYVAAYSGGIAGNNAPLLANPGAQSDQAGSTISLQISASDPDNDPLSFVAMGLPTGLIIDGSTGEIAGIPTDDGTYNVTVWATDGDLFDVTTFTWTITPETGEIYREWWNGIFGKTIPDLTNDPDYPADPDGSDLLTSFEIPVDNGSIYGTRIRGFVHPQVSGQYRFWIAADNAGELWLSTDESPANAALIASVPAWTSSREWNKYPSQQSILIDLVGGEKYYVEALHKEEWGGDNLAVAWLPPGGTQEVIDGIYLSPIDPNAPEPNRAPGITNPGDQTNYEGNAISLQIQATDPDNDPIAYSAGGLPANLSIDANSGLIAGTLITGSAGSYPVTIYASDGELTGTVSFNWTVVEAPTGGGTGQILREWWTNIFGTAIIDLTSSPDYPANPAGSDFPVEFEAPTDWNDKYGTRMRGYLHPTVTGQYRFWIASDDNGELWLSSDDDPINAVLIASVPGWTYPQEWDKYGTQQSVLITLQAGEKYYIEALQKDNFGGDNLAVAWLPPAGTQEVIDGAFLSPFDPSSGGGNRPPSIVNPGPQINFVDDVVALDLTASDPDGDPLSFTAQNLPASLSIDANNGQISGMTTVTGTFTVTVIASDGVLTGTAEFLWQVNDTPPPGQTGQIFYEEWQGIFGNTVADLTNHPDYPDNPDDFGYLTSFEIGIDVKDLIGTRVRGYIHPAVTGQYQFWIAADNRAELWLSSDEDPANAVLIAHAPNWTNSREWNKFPEQASALITLQAGQKYYVEALHKEEWGGDNMAVAWLPPGGSQEVIPGQYLSAFDNGGANLTINAPADIMNAEGDRVTETIGVNGSGGSGFAPTQFQFMARGLPAGLTIDPHSGEISGPLHEGVAGIYDVTIFVSDGTAMSNESLIWVVNDADHSPLGGCESLPLVELGIAQGSAHFQLDWIDLGPDYGVEVTRSTKPYAINDAVTLQSYSSQAVDYHASLGGNYFYSGEAIDKCGNSLPASNQVGIFNFAIESGD